VVRRCIPIGKSLQECGIGDLILTVAQERYRDSPFVRVFREKVVQPDIERSYWFAIAMFAFILVSVLLVTLATVRNLIAKPIEAIMRRIKEDGRSLNKYKVPKARVKEPPLPNNAHSARKSLVDFHQISHYTLDDINGNCSCFV
jgi:hypothetical protein